MADVLFDVVQIAYW